MKIRSFRKKIWYGALAGAALMLTVCCVGGYFGYKHLNEKQISEIEKYNEKLTELELAAGEKEVGYALIDDIKKGELITESMVKKVYLPDGAKSEDTLDLVDFKVSDEYNLYAKTDLLAKTVLTSSLFYEDEPITNDIREGEFNYIEIPTNVGKDSYIDVRVQFPTGDEYVVLTKKKVKDLQGVTMHLNVGEGELLTLSSAVVDAYIEGAKIYAIPYVDEHMQDESITTYPVKTNVKELIKESPNVVNIAKHYLEQQNRGRLEQNLRDLSVEQRSKVSSGEEDINSKVQADTVRRDQEARLNAANEIQQQDLVGGGDQ